MEDKLIELLEGLNYPVFRQGSLTGDSKYPDDFFTFWNVDSPDHAYYDNTDYGTSWSYNIFFYSINPVHTYDVLADAIDILKAAGWVVGGKGFDVVSDEITHTGRGINVEYLEV